MSRDPWIGRPFAGCYNDDDDDDPEEPDPWTEASEKFMQEQLANARAEDRRMQQRMNEILSTEHIRAAARAQLAKEHPVLTTGAIVGTALAKLFDGSLF